jgi:hypothetical protein
MGHCVNPQELIDMKNFIENRLSDLEKEKENEKEQKK